MTTSTADFLATVPLFNGLDRGEVQQFADLSREKTFPKGSVILFENDPGDSLYVIRSGRCKVVLIGEDGREVILGVLGESNRMLDREREQLIQTAVQAAGAMPVIVGTSHSGTRAALGLSQMAESLGADGVMVTPQAEPVPNEERVFEYYRTIAEGIRIPVVLQDHPASTGVHMSVPLMLRIVSELPGVASIKEEATPTPPRIRALLQGMKARKVPILTGLGALYGEFDLDAGSSGFNTGFAFPEVLQAMVKAVRSGQVKRAQELYTRFLPLIVFEQQPGVAVR